MEPGNQRGEVPQVGSDLLHRRRGLVRHHHRHALGRGRRGATAWSASRWANSSTPIGASRKGDSSRRPNSSIERLRAETSRSIRGTIRTRSKAARFPPRSSFPPTGPQPPRRHMPRGSSPALPGAQACGTSTGTCGCPLETPARYTRSLSLEARSGGVDSYHAGAGVPARCGCDRPVGPGLRSRERLTAAVAVNIAPAAAAAGESSGAEDQSGRRRSSRSARPGAGRRPRSRSTARSSRGTEASTPAPVEQEPVARDLDHHREDDERDDPGPPRGRRRIGCRPDPLLAPARRLAAGSRATRRSPRMRSTGVHRGQPERADQGERHDRREDALGRRRSGSRPRAGRWPSGSSSGPSAAAPRCAPRARGCR